LRERNYLPRKSAAPAGVVLGVRPLFLVACAMAFIVLVWFLYGWLTYPVAR
jgi:hypothetical protein